MNWQSLTSQQRSLVLLVSGGLVILLSVGILVGNTKNISKVMDGPTKVSGSQIARARSPHELPQWIQCHYGPIIETNLGLTNSSNSNSVHTRYVLLEFEGRMLITELYNNQTDNPVAGTITVWTGGLQAEVVERIRTKFPAHRDKLLPFHLTAKNSPKGEMVAMLICCVVFFSIGAGLIFSSFFQTQSSQMGQIEGEQVIRKSNRKSLDYAAEAELPGVNTPDEAFRIRQ